MRNIKSEIVTNTETRTLCLGSQNNSEFSQSLPLHLLFFNISTGLQVLTEYLRSESG